MNQVTRKAYAKINLGLDVVGVLPNGYHEVKMIMQNVGVYDTLTFTKREDDKIEIYCNDEAVGPCEDNLIYKAIMLLRKLSPNQIGISVNLEKNIPIAAGMAGGSSDAAATLLGVNELLELGISEEVLMRESVAIGADVPYCVLGKTALSEGIGEKLTQIPMPPQAHLVVAKPDLYVPTPGVYKKLDAIGEYAHPDIDGILDAIKNQDLKTMTQKLDNVLALVTEAENPVITQVKDVLVSEGALGALMSGSGPSVFAIFEEKEVAEKAADKLREAGLSKQIFVTQFV